MKEFALPEARAVARAVRQGISDKYNEWLKDASLELGHFSSTHALVATQMLSVAVTALLLSQVPEAAVSETLERLFDACTDEEVAAKLVLLRREKDDILWAWDDLIARNADRIAEVTISEALN